MKRSILDNGQGYFKPWATRTPVLLLLLFVTFLLIGLAELACHVIPEHGGWGSHRHVKNKRNEVPPVPLAHLSSPSASVPHPTPISSAPIHDQSCEIALQPGSVSTSVLPSSLPTSNRASDAWSLSEPPRSCPEGCDTIKPTHRRVIPEHGGETLAFTPTATPAGALSASAPITVINAKRLSEDLNQVLNFTIERKHDAIPTPIWTVTNGQHFTEVSAAFPTTSGIIPFEYVKKILPILQSPSPKKRDRSTKTAPVPISTIVNSTGTFFMWSNGQSTPSATISYQQYLLVSFVPLILATLFTIPWKILDNTIKEMEPFYQLSRPGGATAENSICLDYATSTIFTVPVKAISRGHMLVFCSSLISLIVIFLPSLGSVAFFVSLTGPKSALNSAWAVNPKFIRILQASLFFIAILVIFMIVYSCRRTYNIYSEPLSIAGVACLLSLSPALETFQRIDSKTKQKELNRLLAGKRFAILELSDTGQSPCPAIIELSPNSPSTMTDKSLPRKELRFQSPKTPESTLPSDFQRSADEEWAKPEGRLRSVWEGFKAKLHLCLAMLFLCAVFIMIAFNYITNSLSGFEIWMNSQTFGVRFVWTALGTGIKLILIYLDRDLRRNEPYRRLLLGSGRPEDSILVPVYLSPFSAILPSLRRRHFHVSLVCFASVLAEFLPICFGNIPYDPSTPQGAYDICNKISMLMLLFMIACIAVSILRPRKRVKHMFRKTDTIASVCCYVASTPSGNWDAMGMLDKMRGLSKLGTSERNKFIMKSGGLYSMGIAEGGELRIDCDERVTKLGLD